MDRKPLVLALTLPLFAVGVAGCSSDKPATDVTPAPSSAASEVADSAPASSQGTSGEESAGSQTSSGPHATASTATDDTQPDPEVTAALKKVTIAGSPLTPVPQREFVELRHGDDAVTIKEKACSEAHQVTVKASPKTWIVGAGKIPEYGGGVIVHKAPDADQAKVSAEAHAAELKACAPGFTVTYATDGITNHVEWTPVTISPSKVTEVSSFTSLVEESAGINALARKDGYLIEVYLDGKHSRDELTKALDDVASALEG